MKNIIPDFLTHYHLPDRQPFLTLSDLDGEELNSVLAELRLKTQNGESKRMFADWYIDERKKTEFFLREQFLKKGGKVQRQFPIYFVLGRSETNKAMVPEMKELTLALENIPKEFISFTYPDSMATLALDNDPVYKKPYNGKVFTYDELLEVVQQFGYPKDEIAKCSKFGYPNYIEAQIWCNLK